MQVKLVAYGSCVQTDLHGFLWSENKGVRLDLGEKKEKRVRDLIRSGVIKQAEKPLWYDVYAAFPPKLKPLYMKPKERFGKIKDPIQEIFYQEDKIRGKFYELYGNGPKFLQPTVCRFVEKYQALEAQGETDEERLFEETSKALLAEGITLRRRGEAGVLQWTAGSSSQQAAEKLDPGLDLRLQELLKEMQEDQQQQQGHTAEKPQQEHTQGQQ
uniref:Small ribosomal subunit protein mS23 n=1 Tax=Callorhinchus milii TaxID=7868 RepID=A0A4W3IN86_CALMI